MKVQDLKKELRPKLLEPVFLALLVRTVTTNKIAKKVTGMRLWGGVLWNALAAGEGLGVQEFHREEDEKKTRT